MRSFCTIIPARGSRGSALVEFALFTFVLIPIFIGAQFGYRFYEYNLLSTQIRTGARYASRRTFRCADPASIARYKTAIANMVRFGNPEGSGPLLEPGLAASQIDVRIMDRTGGPAGPSNAPVSVSVSTRNYTVDTLLRKFDLSGKPILEFPYVGQYLPAGSEPR